MTDAAPVLVLVDAAAGAPARASLQAISAARTLAEAIGTRAEGVALSAEAADAAAPFLPLVHRVELPRENAESRIRALDAARETTGAEVVVLGGTRGAGAVAPRLAMRAGGALLEEATSLAVEEGTIVATRLAHLQRVSETVRASASPVVVTTKIGAFEPAAPVDAAGEVRDLEVGFAPEDARVEVRDAAAGDAPRLGLEEAEVVVAGGRGLGGAEGFDALAEPLARRLGGVVGATRAVVDAGWRPYEEQIGQTGKTVAPALYLALGVSGAVQHLSGMNRSRRVVAIDRDPDAPIFRHCDVGVVGDVHAVVPALLEALGGDEG